MNEVKIENTGTVFYVRQSKAAEGDTLGVDRQVQECQRVADNKGLTLTEIYEDNNKSATNGRERPEYQRLLTDIASGKVKSVIVYHQDRLGRNVMELLHFGALVVANGVKVVSVSGGDIDFTSDDGEFMAIVGAAVAAKETKRKSARQKLAARQKAESGEGWWSARPFGFAYYDGKPVLDAEGRPTLDEAEADAIRGAYSSFLAGSSLRSIAADLDAAGFTTPRGNAWRTSSQVRQMLQAPRNAGLRSYVGDDVLREAAWPPIVPRDIWEGAVAILADESRLTGGSRARKHLLSNLVLCGVCGSRMGSGISGRGKTIYSCRNCNRVSRDGSSLDNLVTEAVISRLSKADAIELTRPERRDDLDELRTEARALRVKLDELGVEYTDGELPISMLKSMTARITERLTGIEAELQSAQTTHVYDGIVGAADVRGAFLALDLDRRRAVIADLVEVTVLPTARGARFRVEDVRIAFQHLLEVA